MKKISASQIQTAKNPEFSGSKQLYESEVALKNYSKHIVSLIYKRARLINRIDNQKRLLLEFGAGTGFLANIFREVYSITPECVELDPKLMRVIREKHFECYQFISEAKKKYAAIYTSNVLEHIEEDESALLDLWNAISPNGTLIIYVPAHQMLYTGMDVEIGHVRRYSRKDLKEKVISAGFEIESVTYADFLGFFATLVVKILGYRKVTKLGSLNSLLLYDKFLFPISRGLDFIGFRFITGKNLILVAKKS
jgi:SAM-dependent methyltransferase